ncbi:MAG: hypothetical protein ACLR8Y_14340 [Alistipes indistinctus]
MQSIAVRKIQHGRSTQSGLHLEFMTRNGNDATILKKGKIMSRRDIVIRARTESSSKDK